MLHPSVVFLFPSGHFAPSLLTRLDVPSPRSPRTSLNQLGPQNHALLNLQCLFPSSC